MPTKNDAFDDWSPELPAIDGGEDEDATVGELDDELSSFEDEGDPFDDATAGDSIDGDDFAELDLDDAAAAGDDDEAEIDIGDVGIEDFGDESMLADADEWEGDDDYADLEEASASAPDDGGEEGLFDGSEEAIDEALPELDAGEDDELGEGLLLDDASSALLADEPLPPWADVTWEKKPLALAFEERGELLSLATRDGLCAAVSLRGELLVSRDGGETFETVSIDAPLNDEPVHVTLSKDGKLYLLTASGALLVERNGALAPIVRSSLLALASADESLAALSADPGRGLELIESTDAGISWTARPLEGAAVVVAAAPNPVLATSGAAVGLGSEAGLVVSRDGRDFELVPGCAGTVALAFAGEGSEAPLYAAVYRETENRTYLVRVSAEGHAEVVADLGANDAILDDEAEPIGRANALAWDGARNVLWVAGAFGLVALAA